MIDRFNAFIDEWKRASALERRLPYFQNRVAGASRLIEFTDGLRYPATPENSMILRKLVYFSYLGAPLALDTQRTPLDWVIHSTQGTIISPSGLIFSLEFLDPFVFAETFLANLHYEGRNLTGKTIVDIGAYVGDTALYFAERGAIVYSYEPDPENYAKLLANLELNPRLKESIHPFNVAVGNEGEVEFQVGLGSAGRVNPGAKSSVRIPSTSLDAIVSDQGLVQPFLLKSDSKGAEFLFVRQAALKAFERLAIEYYATREDMTIEILLSTVKSAGFDDIRITKHSTDGLTLGKSGLVRARALARH